ncbi:thiol-disulfide isomerase/thioredoxin [Ulvibacter sp. MAR_2010_11]|uniref:TlpA family protein disulfide reductase n=1 Tax=Ulvibacter sp. MAR_2010_11 TaxID=1250229 RepID=UPI000C2BBC41|nr:TlpA disulfide reductase family protein [Ulvibacter sp. MAR_2010_11]PKA84258.1 thiol-disulfide isomerase/thioredoxin [Ulvibacter sp. MAR_2010_11]
MKKIVFLLAALVIISCNKEEKKPEYVIINGTVQNSNLETAMVRGNDFEVEIPISEAGTFTDTLRIKTDGMYDLFIGRERTPTYLEKGANLSVTVDLQEFDETISYSGDLAVENNYLAAKYLLSEKEKPFQEVYSLNEAEFMAEANAIDKGYRDLLSGTEGISETFSKMESQNLDYAHVMNLENYQQYNRYFTGNKEFSVSEKYYDYTKNVNFSDTTAFRASNAYQRMLDTHFSRLVSEASEGREDFNISKAYLTTVNEALPNGYAKDQLMYDYLQFGLRPDASLDEVYALYKNSNPGVENLNKVTERYNKLKPLQPGNVSPTFDYENFMGGTTKLENLSGKYVYIDVWATWCGPCIREIPALKEVEAAYHGKNIAFVSISIDVPNDYDKWKAMVVEKELGGIQLMADNNWKSKFVEEYGILGIPRFILIDPQGKIVDADAPRPSDAKLRSMLDKMI